MSQVGWKNLLRLKNLNLNFSFSLFIRSTLSICTHIILGATHITYKHIIDYYFHIMLFGCRSKWFICPWRYYSFDSWILSWCVNIDTIILRNFVYTNNLSIHARASNGRMWHLRKARKAIVLHRKPCICDNFWCVKCKVLHSYVKTRSKASWIVKPN